MIKQIQKSLATEDYLDKQNSELKARVLELEQLLELNKEALRVSINYSNDKVPLKQLVNTLYDQNAKLKEFLERSYNESTDLHSKLLICQQIVRAGQDNEKHLVDELKDKILGLKTQVRERERRVVELEKATTSYDSENGMHLRLVEVSAPSVLSLKFHQELEELRDALCNKNQELVLQQGRCSDLLRVNLALTRQLGSLKVDSGPSLKHNKGNSELSQALQYHQKLMNMSDSSYSEESHEQQIVPTPKRVPVPKLQMAKAKHIQQIIVKKINSEEKKKGKNQDSFLKNDQVVTLKKTLHRELIKNIAFDRKISQLTRLISQLEERNQRLVNSISTRQDDVVIIDSVLELQTQEQECSQAKQQLIQIGREVYQNDNIDRVVNGLSVPVYAKDWSKSLMVDSEYYSQ